MAKWLFVQPSSFHAWEALGIGYLISSLKAQGETDIQFMSGFFDSDEDIVAAGNRADIVGFGCTSPQIKHATQLASKIKAHTVFGGVHPSVLPEETLEVANQVVVGEGERAIVEIARGNREPIVRCMNIEDLDGIPPPDRRTIKQERNIQTAKSDSGERMGSLFSSRGCPYDCTFCASKGLWTRKVRFRSAENIYEEFAKITKDLRLDFTKFSDDTFTLRRELVEEFCRLKMKARDKTPWGANVRVNNVDMRLFRLLRKAGCREVWMGVESGDPAILKEMKKGITVEQVRKAFSAARTVGIKTRAYMLIGVPSETKQTIRRSQELVDVLRPDCVGWTLLAPYPGSHYYDPEKHRDVDWSRVDEYENDLISSGALTNEQLKSEQARLVERYSSTATFRQRQLRKRPTPRFYVPPGGL